MAMEAQDQLKQILLLFAKQLQDQQVFMLQLSADLAALKNVVFGLDARALAMFERQVQNFHDKFCQASESHLRETQVLIPPCQHL